MSTTIRPVTITTAPSAPASTPSPAVVDPIRVERGHRLGLAITAIVVVTLSTAGIVAVRSGATSTDSAPPGSAVVRTDALESAHGQGGTIRTGAGLVALVAAPTVTSAAAPVVHRRPPRGMADDTVAASNRSTQRSEGPRNVAPGQPLGA